MKVKLCTQDLDIATQYGILRPQIVDMCPQISIATRQVVLGVGDDAKQVVLVCFQLVHLHLNNGAPLIIRNAPVWFLLATLHDAKETDREKTQQADELRSLATTCTM